ncbi:acyl-CoA dehydrogenase family protein [Rhodococcus erythropolis]|uniref:acyl-CoA dehydrogenase family protein n=1 Tax=Rhodococcus erythropolis TaxID=1833 RepID=UPI00379A936C
MDIDIAPQLAEFREEIRRWLDDHLVGEFAQIRGVGSPTDDAAWEARLAWEKELGAGGWLGLGWPREYGGRGASLAEEVVFEYEYARAAAPARVGTQALELLGPTLIRFGTDRQRERFLPKIVAVEEMWGQGFSEPGSGSDLASVSTRARRDGDDWVIDGQKIWTTFGHHADWLYVLCRTDPDSTLRHKGLSLLLVPVDQPGVEVRPIRNLAGGSEFSECYFDGARTSTDMVVGEVGGGWPVVMATLGMERGAALMPMQLSMEREVQETITQASKLGATADPRIRRRLTDAYIAVHLMRSTNLRIVSDLIDPDAGVPGARSAAAAAIMKLFASTEHQKLGELALDIQGDLGLLESDEFSPASNAQKMFLLSRAETIYGGTAEIQRNIVSERVLGLPR